MLNFLRHWFSRPPSHQRIHAREKLYEAHFGSAPEIFHSTDRTFPHIDMYHFQPTEARPYHTLITGGMAEYRQEDTGEMTVPKRLELIIYLATFEMWAANTLKVFAEYPAQNETFFAPYHTVPIGYRLTDRSEISAILLAPPATENLSSLEFSVEGDPVNYLIAIPITTAEHAFAREVDSEKLYDRLKQAGLMIHSDDERRSIVDYTPSDDD